MRRPAVGSALRAPRVFHIKNRSAIARARVRAMRPWYVTWGQCAPTLVRWLGNTQTATTKEGDHLSLMNPPSMDDDELEFEILSFFGDTPDLWSGLVRL